MLASGASLTDTLHMPRDGSTRRDSRVREAVVKLAQAYCSAYAEAQAARLRAEGIRLGCITALRAGPLGTLRLREAGAA